MAKLSLDEKITLLEEAQEHIVEAVAALSEATRGDEYIRRTMIAGLEILIETGGWLSRDMTIPQLIKNLREDAELDEDAEDSE